MIRQVHRSVDLVRLGVVVVTLDLEIKIVWAVDVRQHLGVLAGGCAPQCNQPRAVVAKLGVGGDRAQVAFGPRRLDACEQATEVFVAGAIFDQKQDIGPGCQGHRGPDKRADPRGLSCRTKEPWGPVNPPAIPQGQGRRSRVHPLWSVDLRGAMRHQEN